MRTKPQKEDRGQRYNVISLWRKKIEQFRHVLKTRQIYLKIRSDNMKNIRRICFTFLVIILMGVNCNTATYANSTKKEAPTNVVVKQYKNKKLKVKWKKVQHADGYRIYKYSKKKKKYITVKTIYNNDKTSWRDEDLKYHRVYKYKVASFEVHKGKKNFSKKSYWVSARTYGKKGKLVNAERIDIDENSPINIGLCSNVRLETTIFADEQSKNKNPRVFSKKVRWVSSDKTMAKVNKQGRLISFDKEGTCYVGAITHNGKTKKIKVNVINYANPKSFPYYEGSNVYINDLLMNYRTEVSNIATYFTKYAKNDEIEVIERDANGNIIGMPQFDNISEIKADIDKLITQFPLVMKIYYSNQGVSFKMNYDASGSSYCEVAYYKWNDCEDSPLKIAPHWTAKQKVTS
jgi:hypothetical protein